MTLPLLSRIPWHRIWPQRRATAAEHARSLAQQQARTRELEAELATLRALQQEAWK